MKLQNPFALYRHLPKAVYVLFLATVINGLGMFVYPFLTLYLTQKLGYSPLAAGTFMTVASSLYIPGSFIGSKLADTFGRKPVLAVFQLLVDICFFLCGCFEGNAILPYLLLLALFFDGAVDPAREALKTDVTSFENRQASFSFIYMGHNVGYAVGPVIAGVLFYTVPRWLFWGSAISGILSVVLVLFMVQESKPTEDALEASRQSDSTEKAERGGLLKALLTRPRVLLFALCITFYSYAYGQVLFGLPLYTTELFGKAGAPLYGRLMGLNAICVVVLTPLVVNRLKGRHPLANTMLAGLFYAVGFTSLAFTGNPLGLYGLTVIFTVGEILTATNDQFYVANNTPMSHRARFSPIIPIIMGTGEAIAPIIGGSIIERSSMDFLWFSAGIASLVGAVDIWAIHLGERKRSR